MSEENKIPPEEQQVNKEPIDEIISSAEPIAEAEQRETNNEKQETENMEVHHHTHPVHGKKSWKAYFWEFLMLFLAVFCGFLAEYKLEHVIEQQREKQYMKSMIEDLMLDTAELNHSIELILTTIIPTQQKTLSLVYLDRFPDSVIRSMYETVPRSAQSVTLYLQDRTTQQLKNSGNLRLIRNSAVTDSLAKYWYQCDLLKNELYPGYDRTRQSLKDILYMLHSYQN